MNEVLLDLSEIHQLMDEASRLRIENERLKNENFKLAAHQCLFTDGSGLIGHENGSQICLKQQRIEELEAQPAQPVGEITSMDDEGTWGIVRFYRQPLPDKGTPIFIAPPPAPLRELSDEEITRIVSEMYIPIGSVWGPKHPSQYANWCQEFARAVLRAAKGPS